VQHSRNAKNTRKTPCLYCMPMPLKASTALGGNETLREEPMMYRGQKACTLILAYLLLGVPAAPCSAAAAAAGVGAAAGDRPAGVTAAEQQAF
jgi:hypothetical protein